MLVFLNHSFIYIIENDVTYIAIIKMMQARSQATVIYSYHCFHKLHSGNAETGAGQASPTTSGQT